MERSIVVERTIIITMPPLQLGPATSDLQPIVLRWMVMQSMAQRAGWNTNDCV